MEISVTSLRSLPLVLLLFSTAGVASQETNANTSDFSCSPAGSAGNCSTYVVYCAQSPELARVSDLFGRVDRQLIAKANSLTSEEAELVPGQLLLVPISCGCTSNRSFANISYQLKEGDTFFSVSTMVFERLTDSDAVQDLNPTLLPSNLTTGVKVVFPIYCKCPTRTQLLQGFNYLITYVWQAEDSVEQLSKMMGSSSDAILSANNGRNFSAAVGHPVLIPVSELPYLPRPSPSTTRGKSKHVQRTKLIISCTVGATAASILWCFLLFAYYKYRKARAFIRPPACSEADGLPQVKRPSEDKNSCPKNPRVELLLTGVSDCLDKPVLYSIEAIMEGTGNLDEKCRIGGAVFRTSMNGELLAVKKPKGDVSEELKILRRVNHANLVKLTGIAASSGGEFFLVYEYAENGSLHGWLHHEAPPSWRSRCSLSWQQRLSIALDVANGLQYLHQLTSPSIVHGDIRATNILLDAHFKAKISNFSRAKPAAIADGTLKADVFAFGLLLLELLSGRKAVETRENGEIAMSWREVRMVLEGEDEGRRKSRLRRWMDPNMEGLHPIEGALSLAEMAKACTSEPSKRPSMAEIGFGLSVLAESCVERPRTSNFCADIQITNPAFSP